MGTLKYHSNIQEWFDQHEPFNLDEDELCSLSSSLTAVDRDGINCDRTAEDGARIQKKLDHVSITQASLKTRDQVKSLNHYNHGYKLTKTTFR